MDDFNSDVTINIDTVFDTNSHIEPTDHNSTNIESNDIKEMTTSELNLNFKPGDLVQGIIYSEILGKPRALSPFRRRIR